MDTDDIYRGSFSLLQRTPEDGTRASVRRHDARLVGRNHRQPFDRGGDHVVGEVRI